MLKMIFRFKNFSSNNKNIKLQIYTRSLHQYKPVYQEANNAKISETKINSIKPEKHESNDKELPYQSKISINKSLYDHLKIVIILKRKELTILKNIL